MNKTFKFLINGKCAYSATVTLKNERYEVEFDGDIDKFDKLEKAVEFAKSQVFDIASDAIWRSIYSGFNSWEDEKEDKCKKFNELDIRYVEE